MDSNYNEATSSTPGLDELRGYVDRLQSLLKDPHPGLFTWVQAYGAAMTAIDKFWNAQETPWTTEDILHQGGAWLGEAHDWMKWNLNNGDTVTFGSEEVIKQVMTVKQLEQFAAAAVAGERNSKR